MVGCQFPRDGGYIYIYLWFPHRLSVSRIIQLQVTFAQLGVLFLFYISIYILSCPAPTIHCFAWIVHAVRVHGVKIMLASPLSVVLVALGIWILYLFVYIIYTLYFHPLAKFPGPKLAALTDYYGFYYNAIKGGRYIEKMAEMHKRYGDNSLALCSFLYILTCEIGPIVRITPDELHIKDSEFFDKIYTGSRKVDKEYKFVMLLSAPTSTFGTIGHDHHRQRLSAIRPFFSKRSVTELEPMVCGKVEQFCQRLAAVSGTKEVINLTVAYMALSTDVITEYCFGDCTNYLRQKDFSVEWAEIMKYVFKLGAFWKLTPWIHRILRVTPIFIMNLMSPKASSLLHWQRIARKRASSCIEKYHRGEKAKRTIFQGLLDSDLPPEEKTTDRLSDEAQTMLLAGSETLSSALSCTTFFVLHDKTKLKKLRDELASVPFEQLGNKGLLTHLQKLPYLVGYIH
jgi:Cytochrome P450